MSNELNQEAERAVFEAWTRKDIGMPDHVPFNWESDWAKAAFEGWIERARRASAPAPADVALPAPFVPAYAGGPALYTAEQVEQIRREAVEYGKNFADVVHRAVQAGSGERYRALEDERDKLAEEVADLRAALSCQSSAACIGCEGKPSGSNSPCAVCDKELRQSSAVGMKPKLWFKHLTGAECKPDGRCYDVAFTPMQGYEPLYAAPALADAPQAAQVEDLAALIRQLAYSLKKAKPGSDLAARAVDYLRRKDLLGSPLRSATAQPVEQTQKGQTK